MSTKQIQQTEAERLKARLLEAEQAQAEKAVEIIAEKQSLPAKIAEAEELQDEATTRLRVIEYRFGQGDDSVTAEEYATTLADVRRRELIAAGFASKVNTLQPPNTSTDVAEVGGILVGALLGPAVDIVTTSLPEAEALSLLRDEDGSLPTCVLICQTKPTEHAGSKVDAGGAISGQVSVKYVARQQHAADLSLADIKRKAYDLGMDCGDFSTSGQVNSFALSIHYGFTTLPRLNDAPMSRLEELDNLSRRVASAVAHGVRIDNAGAVPGGSVFSSGLAKTRPDGARLVSSEVVDGVRRAVVDVSFALRLTPVPNDQPTQFKPTNLTPRAFVANALHNVEGTFARFYGVVESVEVLDQGYAAEPIEGNHQSANDLSGTATGMKVRLTFTSAPR